MPIVTPKQLPETERLNVQIDKAIYNDLMLYTKMINEPDKAHIVNSLLEYALKRDKEFKSYKAEIKKQRQNQKEADEHESHIYKDKPT